MAQKAKTPKLFDRVGSYWDGRDQNSRDGLAILDECIRRTASKDRDWDALARFFARSKRSNASAKVKRIIRGAFGNQLKVVADKKHPTGVRFEMAWEGAFPLRQSNTYGLVRDALTKGVGWDDKEFLAELNKVIPAPEKAAPRVDEAAQHKAAKHIVNYIVGKRKDGMDIAAVMAEVKSLLASESKVSRKVVNGVEVIEPNF